MNAPTRSVETLVRENGYLKQRNAQLQDDLTTLAAETERLRQILERIHGRAGARTPGSLSGGGESSSA